MFTKLKIFVAVIMISLSMMPHSFASDILGPNIGDTIPHALDLNDQDGEPQTLDSLAGEKGLVLFFVRSLDWCPYCKVQALDLNNRSAEFTDLGYNVATISYDDEGVLKTFSDKYQITFSALSDQGSDVIKAFGLLNEEYEADSFAYGVPHPVVFVIYPDQTIGAKYAEEGYKERPNLNTILKDLRSE